MKGKGRDSTGIKSAELEKHHLGLLMLFLPHHRARCHRAHSRHWSNTPAVIFIGGGGFWFRFLFSSGIFSATAVLPETPGRWIKEKALAFYHILRQANHQDEGVGFSYCSVWVKVKKGPFQVLGHAVDYSQGNPCRFFPRQSQYKHSFWCLNFSCFSSNCKKCRFLFNWRRNWDT